MSAEIYAWSVSEDERYHGLFDSIPAALEEGRSTVGEDATIYVGRCVRPNPPLDLDCGYILDSYFEDNEELGYEWFEDQLGQHEEDLKDLQRRFNEAFEAWKTERCLKIIGFSVEDIKAYAPGEMPGGLQ